MVFPRRAGSFLPLLGLLCFSYGARPTTAQEIGSCQPARAENYLYINNVRARVFNNGNLFWRGSPHVYEVPRGGEVHALYNAGLWVGGELRAAAARYGNYTFWPGAVLALLATGYTFSFMAFIGLTSLVGIVVNNSIILVDYANQLRQEGRSPVEAIHEAGQTRFTPILLTTLTTIGGLLPLTLQGSTLWSPMGWAIIGGLLVSTVLTLVVVPVLYKVFTPAPRPA